MAKYWLINQVLLQTGKKLPGDMIDDTVDNIAQIQSGGGVLWPFADSIVADAAAKAQVSRISKAVNEQDLSNQMAAACQDSTRLKGAAKSPNLAQDKWYIHAGTGNNNNSGKVNNPIKSWAQMLERLGFGALAPVSGQVNVYLLSDLPANDPIFWPEELILADANIIVHPKWTTLATGTLSAVQNKNRSANDSYTVTAAGKPADFFADKHAMTIKITSGTGVNSYAFIMEDLGSATARVSEWLEAPNDFEVFQSTPPAASSGFAILSPSKANLTTIAIQARESDLGSGFGAFCMNGVFVDATGVVRIDSGNGYFFAPNCIMSGPNNLIATGNRVFMTNVFQAMGNGSEITAGGKMFVAAGGAGDARYKSTGGAELVVGGDYMMVGGGSSLSTEGGILLTGAFSAFGTHESVGGKDGVWRSGEGDGFDPRTGEYGFPPAWGSGNDFLVSAGENLQIAWNQEQFAPVATPIVLPFHDGVMEWRTVAGFLREGGKLYPFDSSAAEYTAAVDPAASSYAALAVAQPAGFRDYVYNESGAGYAFRAYQAAGAHPDTGCTFSFVASLLELI